eukprot:TRINITY_DN54_c0_g1_i1.p3 TRINITY_DN54_c0_g1~~TRINITY_DN54_c0_g1_i1.p3  ORF type:complete len:185 (+),score=13.44 TRINITY_DN54_c0_g1_i1:237-791(+)
MTLVGISPSLGLLRRSPICLRTGSALAKYQKPWGSLRRRDIRPICYNPDGSVQKVLRIKRFTLRAPAGHVYSNYFHERHLYASDMERTALELIWPTIGFISLMWVWVLGFFWLVTIPGFEKNIDDTLALWGAPSLAQKINLGIVREADIRFSNSLRFWDARPTQWYGDEYLGSPRVGVMFSNSF